MKYVKPKKKLGQHFLKDDNLAKKIVDSFNASLNTNNILEIGPGMGALTKHLLPIPVDSVVKLAEIDHDSISYLINKFPELNGAIISADFLKMDISTVFKGPFSILGNFPYNISSQIIFKMLAERDRVKLLVGMFQKEVAERICAPPKNKTYGILSVLVQAFYETDYLFTVNPTVFDPPPKVKSAVIKLTRKQTSTLPCNEDLFFKVVKKSFNQRRKILKNALNPLLDNVDSNHSPLLKLRAEQLNVEEFVELTNMLDKS